MNRKEYNDCVREYADRLYRYCLKVCDANAEAEDAVQLAFVKLWKNHECLEKRSAKSWLFTTAYRNVIDEKRKQQKREAVMLLDEPTTTATTESFELKEILNQALSELPLEQKQAVLLRDYEGYSYKEISDITGFSESKVKTLIFRARKRLQNNPALVKEMKL